MLRAGTYAQVITPPVGTSLSGYFYDRISTAVHDDLYAKALVLECGMVKVGIVICDIIHLMTPQVNEAREIASKATGIYPDHIMVACTHTHTGPETYTDRPMVPINEEYVRGLPTLIAEAVIKANENLIPVSARIGDEFEYGVSFNRRFRMKDGSVKFNPGKLNPNIVGPDGPIDPQINVLRLDDETGQPMCIMANFSLHVDVKTGCEISADFPGEMSRIVSSLYDSKPLVIFMQGTCGNINHIDVTTDKSQDGWHQSSLIARVLAGKVLAASELSQPMTDSLGVATDKLDIKYAPMTDFLRTHAEEVLKQTNPDEKEFAQAKYIQTYNLDGQSANVEIQTIRIGDTAIVAVPGEYFVEYGLSIKDWSPFEQTFVGELANGSFGYIPTSDAFYPGTYETLPILSARLEASAGVRIANAAGQLLRKLAEPEI